MWYFSWMLGLGLAVALGIINVLWLESNFAFGLRKEEETEARFRDARDARDARSSGKLQSAESAGPSGRN